MFVEMLPLTLSSVEDFVDANLLVPASYGEEVFRVRRGRVEGEICDAVFRRVLELDIALQIAHRVRVDGRL